VSVSLIVLRESRLDPAFPLSRNEFLRFSRIVLDAIGLDEGTVTVKLVDDAEIERLNRAYIGCTGPTNVLSFPAEDGDEESDSLGELALSVDALAREAALYGQAPIEHLARLFAHGLLHLAGYDHGEIMYDLTDLAVDRVVLEYASEQS